MTTFFEQQDRARRNTRLLIVLMALAITAMALSFYGVCILLEQWAAARSRGVFEPHPTLFQPSLLLWSVLGTVAVVVLASASRVVSLQGGGAHVAEMLGGRLVSGNPQDTLEKRLVNVVEEMALASGVPVPQVFVLDAETGINAFAAGFALDDAAIAVTRGCLEKLTREQLQGVIAHEFSHVLNGDMRLNIRLMGVVFGIVCIGLFGRLLMRIGGQTRYSSYSYSSRSSRDNNTWWLFVAGLAVFLIGLVGEFFGKLIKAAVSRQREFLADASAVQFTRNPGGISGALQKIGGFPEGANVKSHNAEEASHFFFGDIQVRLFAHSLFATHPPLGERIARIDPTFKGEFAPVADGIAEPDEPLPGVSRFAGAGAAAASADSDSAAPRTGSANPAEVMAQVGAVAASAIDESRRLLATLPPKLREAAYSPFSASAIVYALLLADDPTVRHQQRAKIDLLSGSALHAETLRVLNDTEALPRRDRLPLVALLSPALRELSADQRLAFTHTVQALIDADHAVSIFEYVLGETLRTRLSSTTTAQARSRVRHHALPAVAMELELLLSLLAHAGDFDGTGAQQAFNAGAARLGNLKISLLAPGPKLLSGLGPALEQLASLAPLPAAAVIDACTHAVYADRRVTDDEVTLLRALCDALGAPMPLLDLA